MLAIITGGFLILARIVKLGFIADFLSRSVLIGFLTGVGIQVAMGQLAGMLGVDSPSGGTVTKFVDTLKEIPDTNNATLLVSLSVLGVILGCRMVNPRIPGALIAVVGAIFVSWNWDLSADGVSTLGKVPSGLPSFGIPDVTWTQFEALLATAGACFVVILAQSAATSRAYAAKYGEEFDENVDLVGLGAANISAGLSGTFVVNGSPTKTQMVDSAGGRSQLAQLTTAVIVLIVLLFFTVPLQYMPNAVLASVVFLIGIELIDWRGMAGILRARPDEFLIATATAVTVVVVGVEQAVVLAIILSIIDHLRRSYRPNDTVVAPSPSGVPKEVPYADGVQALPGLVVYRFAASLYYANSVRFTEEIRALVGPAEPAVQWLCVDATAVGDIDYSGQQTLQEIIAELDEQNVRLVFAGVGAPVREELDHYGITAKVGEDGFFPSVPAVLEAFPRRAERGR
jgi:SulP family sulfate permease